MRRSAVLLVVVLALFALAARGSAEGRAPVYQVIVNANNPAASIDREFVADAFLKKISTWPNNEVVHPVDLAPGSPVRRQFSDEVLHRSVAEVKSYWQQRIFSGRDVPPPELDTDEEIVKYVLKYDGAIGYVSGTAALSGTKALTVK
jgi:ABC-type phosphate transport system substrate-binding protein